MAESPEPSIYDIVGWRAYYTDGRRYDSASTPWESLPSDGVLIFVLYQREKKRRRLMCGVTLYWKDGDIFACDNTADAEIPQGLDPSFVKRGKWVTDAEFGQIYEEAHAALESPDETVRI